MRERNIGVERKPSNQLVKIAQERGIAQIEITPGEEPRIITEAIWPPQGKNNAGCQTPFEEPVGPSEVVIKNGPSIKQELARRKNLHVLYQ